MQSSLPRRAAGLVALALLTAAPAAAAPAAGGFSFDTTYGLLPKDVVPVMYRIAVTPDPSAGTFAGRETVDLDVRRPTARLVFNALDLTYASVAVDGSPAASVASDDAAQTTTVTTAATLAPGRHVLAIAYSGKIETAAQGLFRQPYVAADGTRTSMLVTQFEAADARRVFPSWDEPAFKARFQLSATLPAAWTAVSNTPVASRTVNGDTAVTTFAPTPLMSSYLVVLAAGKLGSVSGRDSAGRTHEIVTAAGAENSGRIALANSQQILTDYDAYFGIPYPLPKLSSIGVPGGFASFGAMENWGGIVYAARALLVPPTATLSQRQGVYSVQAHEMAHQWFGDLVTMSWWDDIWLNESFASWMAARETALRHPDWNWWQEQDAGKQTAMHADALPTSHPIRVHVDRTATLERVFDGEITYNKGEAFLRMTERYLGEEPFRRGVRAYMRARKYSNATATDLWNALGGASRRDIAAYAASWIGQTGYPLVTVSARCDARGARTVSLAQQRFLLTGSPSPALWRIPVGMASGATGAPAYTLLATRSAAGIPAGRCGEPLRANVENAGFYRVQYDRATLAANIRAYPTLPIDDRIALLDDEVALVDAGRADVRDVFAMTANMKGERSARPWTIVADELGRLEQFERGTEGHPAFLTFARRTLAPIAARLGMRPRADDTPEMTNLRELVLTSLGTWGDAAVVADARQRFDAFMADRSTLAPDEQSSVLTIVAATADDRTFERLHALAKSARDEAEARRFYEALVAVRNPLLARRAVDIVLSDELPPELQTVRPRLVLAAANADPALAYRAFTSHWRSFQPVLGASGGTRYARVVPETLWEGAPLATLESWSRSVAPKGDEVMVARGMLDARLNLDLKRRLVPDVDRAIAGAPASS